MYPYSYFPLHHKSSGTIVTSSVLCPIYGDATLIVGGLLLMLLLAVLANNSQISVGIGDQPHLVTSQNNILDELAKLLPHRVADAGVLLSEEGNSFLIILEPSILLGDRALAAFRCCLLSLHRPRLE